MFKFVRYYYLIYIYKFRSIGCLDYEIPFYEPQCRQILLSFHSFL